MRNYFAVDRIVLAALIMCSVSLFSETMLANNDGTFEQRDLSTSFNPHGKPFCIFKTFGKKSKYPVVQFYNPLVNEFTTLFCGTRDESSKSADTVKKSSDLQNLGVLCSKTFLLDAGKKIEKKYAGYRETYVGQAMETVLMKVGLLSSDPYAGYPLFDELNKGAALWWVTTREDFENTRIYLESLLAYHNQDDFAQGKIHVILDVTDGTLTADDCAFLNRYFILVDANDIKSSITKFFKDKIKDMGKLAGKKGLGETGQSWTEMLVGMVEKDNQDFKGKELSTGSFVSTAKDLTKITVGTVVTTVITINAVNPIKKYCEENFHYFGKKPASPAGNG